MSAELETYRWRGHRRLAARTYSTKCTTCMWGCRMPVEIITDNWNPRGKKSTDLKPSAMATKLQILQSWS